MADPSLRIERLGALLDHRHRGWADGVDPEGMIAGTPSDPVGQIYGATDKVGYRRGLQDLGIHADSSVYGLGLRYPDDTQDDLDIALAKAVLGRRESPRA